MAEQPGALPDPGQAVGLPEFIGLLGELRAWAGMPSYRVLAKRAGALMRPPRSLSTMTVADAFKTGRRRLDLDLVVAIVRALGADEPAVDRWRQACIKAHARAKAGGPVGVFGQLPTDLATFTGRREELARLVAAATNARDGDSATSNAVVISSIEGMAGVGKTQLAIHAAHQLVRDGHFTETQLHVNLRGFDPEHPPADPSAVLEAFLRQLGVAAQQIPASRDERAAMYRDRLRERGGLVLLDNAADEEQVRDLIPAGPNCLVLITSRRSLAGLDGTTPHLIAAFSETESLDLLDRIAGHERVTAEPEAAARLVDLCDRLPLAVALTAARLRSRPTWSLAALADQLEEGRLDAIRAGGRAIRPVLDLSYQALPASAQQMFRLLGLHPGPDLSTDAAAALTGRTRAGATQTLELLLDENMLQQRQPGRYELHDLLRAHAIELASEDDAAVAAALGRVTSWYAHSVYNALTRLRKTVDTPTVPCEVVPARFGSDEAALAWVAAEDTNLEHALRTAAASGLHETAWHLSRSLDYCYFESGRITDSLRVSLLGAECARKAGNRSGEGRSLRAAGWDHMELGSLPEAESCLSKALELCGAADDLHGKALALNGLGKVSSDRRRFAEALDFYQASLAIYTQRGSRRHVGYVHSNIGVVYFEMKRYDLALTSYLHALEILDSLESDSFTQSVLLGNIAEVHFLTGEYGKALNWQTRCLALTREYGHHLHEADTLLALGDSHAALGHTDQAGTAWAESATLYERLGDPRATEARQRLSNDAHTKSTGT
ncbi:ATP-binding protein [Streptacidiphilus anmyonensis]|uniref:ATP-binding protein n=1 Tax=Streptacidiphilus anmyonensis TaxID=405782 RepID=UPI001364C85D|nr:tetratricopeptide repeat protein [Streptacidiphilus anmyonensis]